MLLVPGNHPTTAVRETKKKGLALKTVSISLTLIVLHQRDKTLASSLLGLGWHSSLSTHIRLHKNCTPMPSIFTLLQRLVMGASNWSDRWLLINGKTFLCRCYRLYTTHSTVITITVRQATTLKGRFEDDDRIAFHHDCSRCWCYIRSRKTVTDKVRQKFFPCRDPDDTCWPAYILHWWWESQMWMRIAQRRREGEKERQRERERERERESVADESVRWYIESDVLRGSTINDLHLVLTRTSDTAGSCSNIVSQRY